MSLFALLLASTVLLAPAAGSGPVNVPYPLSPDEAARDFLRLVDKLQPRPWTKGEAPGAGPFVIAGTLQAKTLTPDGQAVLMLKLPDGQCVLVKSPSSLPEIAVGQRLYAVVDFMGEDGTAAARLRGIALPCDLRGRRAALDAMLGIQPKPSAQPAGPTGQTAGSPAAQPSLPSPGQMANRSVRQTTAPGWGAQTTGQLPAWQAAASPQLWGPSSAARQQGVASVQGRQFSRPPAQPPAAPGQPLPQAGPGQSPQTIPGGAALPSSPPESPQERYRVRYWTQYVLKRNPKLSAAEAEAIVRWVLYYSAYYGVDHRLIFAVMRYESDFNPNCVSRAGAIGLMQLMPGTARELGVNPWVVEENIKGGIAELAGYLDTYSDRSNYEQTILALASYNAGPNAVKRAGGVPQISETVNYVQRVANLFYEFVKSGAP